MSVASASMALAASSSAASRSFPRFLLPSLGRFALRLFERAARLVRFLAHARQLGFEARIGFGAQPLDRAFERARGGLLRRVASFLCGGITHRVGVALRLLVQAPCLLGLHADALDLGLQVRVGVRLDAGDFRLERARGGLLGRLPSFFSSDLTQPLDFLLGFLLCEPRLGGLLAQAFELGDQIARRRRP